jgi:hypothetical protein
MVYVNDNNVQYNRISANDFGGGRMIMLALVNANETRNRCSQFWKGDVNGYQYGDDKPIFLTHRDLEQTPSE